MHAIPEESDACADALPNLVWQVADLVQQCWAQDPAQRPKMAEVCHRLEDILAIVRARVRANRGRSITLTGDSV